MAQYTDDELAGLIKNGNTAAFDCLIDRYYKGLFNFLLRMLANREDAEDALQETFLRAAAGMEKYRMEGKFKSWLFAIANNLAVSEIRQRKRRKLLSPFKSDRNDAGYVNPVDYLPDESYEPARAAENKELAGLLENAVSALPFEQRQVFVLRHAAELSFKEISEALNIPVNTALGRMHYAMKKLKNALGDDLGT